MIRLLLCVLSVQLLSLNEINVQSNHASENGNETRETQSNSNETLLASDGEAIIISSENSTTLAVDPASGGDLETRDWESDNGCLRTLYTKWYRSTAEYKKRHDPTLSPEHIEPIGVEPVYSNDGTRIVRYRYIYPPRPEDKHEKRMKKAQGCLHAVKPLLHFCCCCCAAHWCD